MSEMVDRVARAMWENWRTLEIAAPVMATCDFDEIIRLSNLPGDVGNAAQKILNAGYSQALAAIAAMREPTEAMVEAAADVVAIDLGQFESLIPGKADDVWRAMIDKALGHQT